MRIHKAHIEPLCDHDCAKSHRPNVRHCVWWRNNFWMFNQGYFAAVQTPNLAIIISIHIYIYIHLIYSWHIIMVSLKTLNLFLWAISPYIDRYGSFYDPKLGESYTQWPTSSTRPAILAQPYLPVQMDWCVWKPVRSKCCFFLCSYTIFLLKFPCHVINSVPIFGENHPKSTTELDSLQQILVLSYKVTFMVKTC